jgi:photosystem II stability/assembly factor-like uncharacterized protein
VSPKHILVCTLAGCTLALSGSFHPPRLSSAAAAAPDSAERALTADDLKGLAWRSIGPANMGGRCSAIALVPGSRTSFYVGFGTGGVFKTENLGVTFTPVFDEYPVLSIGAIAVADAPASWRGWSAEESKEAAAAPKAAKKGAVAKDDRAGRGKGKIVWVGTGEGNGRNSSSWGGGVYRSTDAGGKFAHVGLTETHDIPRLAVDPRDPDVCYVAALGHLWGANPERGVYKTADGGKTWQHVLKVDANTGACDVVIDPKNPGTVYAAMYARRRTPWSFTGNSETGGLYRSDNGGGSWKKLTNGIPTRTGRIGIAVYAKDPRIVYATVESDEGGSGRDAFEDRSPTGGLFRSADKGESWTRVSSFSFRPFYFSRLAVDPENDQRVYLPGWDLGVSDDGGRTFRRSGSENVHVDHHAIVVNPVDPNQILIGNDGGVYISHDRAATWDYLNNMAVGQFYRVAVDDGDPYRVAGGLQDNGSWIGPSATGYQTMDESRDGIHNDDWRMFYFGDGFTVQFDPTDPNLVYGTSQGGNLGRVRLDTNVMKAIVPAAREGQPRLRFNWNAPFLVSRHDPTVLYQGGNKVFKHTQRGDRWQAISDDLSRQEVDKIQTVGSDAETYGTVVALAESPVAKGHLWAGTDDGRVHVTTDDGKHWRDVTPAAVKGRYVSNIAASWKAAGTAYVAVDGHRSDVFVPLVLMTEDDGRTWTEITGNLPAGGPAKVVYEDPRNPDVLYCGTEFGCFVTLDRKGAAGVRGAIDWVRINGKALPPAPVDDIVMQHRERDLVVATHGRSIWILDDAGIFAQLTPAVRRRPLALFELRPARPRLYTSRNYGIGHSTFRAKNPPMGAVIDFWVRDRAGESVSVTIADSAGAVVRSLNATSRRGLNRLVWDLQTEGKHKFDSLDEQWLGQTQFVPAGEYKVTVKLDQEKAEGRVRVLPAANAPAPPVRR